MLQNVTDHQQRCLFSCQTTPSKECQQEFGSLGTNNEQKSRVQSFDNMMHSYKWTHWILLVLSFCERVSLEKVLDYNVTNDDSVYDEVTYETTTEVMEGEDSCRFAQLKCSYRTGCGATLHSFIFECDSLIHNKTDLCSDQCKNTLIGLTSTHEGQKLMNCDCNGDKECTNAKQRIEACRASVTYATRADTVVSCTEARWICTADAECGKALEYYHLYCRSMFRGRKCSQRCKNSLGILLRQNKAAKLQECQCANNEMLDNFFCKDIKQNMEDLCFEPEETTTILPTTITDPPSFEDDYNSIDVTEKAKPKNEAPSFKGLPLAVILLLLLAVTV